MLQKHHSKNSPSLFYLLPYPRFQDHLPLSRMAAVLEASVLNPLSYPLQNLRPVKPPPKPLSLSLISPSKPYLCSAENAQEDSDPAPADPNPNSDIGPPSVRKDRKRAVRIAWEKLVRWSRSWRSKAKTDVLERTNKVRAL